MKKTINKINLTSDIIKIVSSVLNINKKIINNKSGPESLDEWDSLKHLNIILACEDFFKIKFTNDEIVEILDIDTMTTIIKEKLS